MIEYVFTAIAVFIGSICGIEYSLWRGERKLKKALRPYTINDVIGWIQKIKEVVG